MPASLFDEEKPLFKRHEPAMRARDEVHDPLARRQTPISPAHAARPAGDCEPSE